MRVWVSMGPWSDPVPLGPERGLGAIGDVELAKDPREVGLHGLLADLEAPCDQLVGQAGDEQFEHLALARGERGERVRRGARIQHGAGGTRVQRRFAARRSADARDDVLGRCVLEQVADRARLDRTQDPRAGRRTT